MDRLKFEILKKPVVAVKGLRGVTEDGKVLAELLDGQVVEITMTQDGHVAGIVGTQQRAVAVFHNGILHGFVLAGKKEAADNV